MEGISDSLFNFMREIVLEPRIELGLSHVKWLYYEIVTKVDRRLNYAML
jgi:hypothetical protein